MFPSPDTSTRATPSLQWVPWPLLAEALRFPTFSGTMGVYDCSSVHSQTSMVDPRCPPYRSRERRRRALLGSWAIPLETCPGLATPATPARPRINGRCQILPSASVKASASQRRTISELNPRGLISLLCTLRTHQSPGEWQHSLLTCLLDLGQTGLARAGLQ